MGAVMTGLWRTLRLLYVLRDIATIAVTP
jgi:hypothetical protein